MDAMEALNADLFGKLDRMIAQVARPVRKPPSFSGAPRLKALQRLANRVYRDGDRYLALQITDGSAEVRRDSSGYLRHEVLGREMLSLHDDLNELAVAALAKAFRKVRDDMRAISAEYADQEGRPVAEIAREMARDRRARQ